MSVPDLPADLVTFLRSGSPPTLDAGHYETVTHFAPDELRVETLEVTQNMTPFAGDHPHADGYGYYAVPGVNLVRGDPRPGLDFPAWLFLWLPVEQRYGSYDLDHGDLYVFPPGAATVLLGSAIHPEKGSTIGHEAAVLIDSFRLGKRYPVANTSTEHRVDPEALVQWWERMDKKAK